MNTMTNTPAAPTDAAPEDADALVLAALAADAQGDSERSTTLLQRSLALRHFNPHAHYLLGTAFAEAGRNGDAVLHMTTAVEQAPQLAEARLQLGLLWLTLDNPATAVAVLSPLTTLPADSALHQFGAALVCVGEGRVEAACAALRAGLAIGCGNAPLMGDMRVLLERLEQNSAGDATAQAELRTLQHGMAISAYSGGSGDR